MLNNKELVSAPLAKHLGLLAFPFVTHCFAAVLVVFQHLAQLCLSINNVILLQIQNVTTFNVFYILRNYVCCIEMNLAAEHGLLHSQ